MIVKIVGIAADSWVKSKAIIPRTRLSRQKVHGQVQEAIANVGVRGDRSVIQHPEYRKSVV